MSSGSEATGTSRELLVFHVRRDTRCGECQTELEHGSLLYLDGERALCLTCADLLVDPDALRQAEEECIADAELRARRRDRAAVQRDAEDQTYVAAFAAQVRALFPGCPSDEATQIAVHACRRYSKQTPSVASL
jgi:hypothetical protein